jgi:hypothetical protein
MKNPLPVVLALCASLFASSLGLTAEQQSFDFVVYGGTPAGVMSAVAAARSGRTTALVEPGYLIGGMMAGGLTKTDVGSAQTIGGLSKEFYARVLDYYTEEFGADSEQVKQTAGGFFFEPKVAGQIFQEMLAAAGVEVTTHERLVDAKVEKNAIASITVENTKSKVRRTVAGRMFVDATYEGDLMAAVGVPYRVGREAREEYDESLAGMNEGPEMYRGKGDHRVQAYNMRSTLTNRRDILVPVPKPKHYNPEAHAGYLNAVLKHNIRTFEELFTDHEKWAMVNGKADPNRSDAVGVNFAYAEGDHEQRARIVELVRDHWLSLWYMLQNDERLPAEFRESAKRWGLPADEYEESGHVSPQVYVRVARRMLGRHMLTESDVDEHRWKDDAICLGSYNFDSHVVQNILLPGGPKDEGYFIEITDDYEIPYRSITPFAPNNLLVVCAVSATHVAYSTLRMEPVFMMIGHAAGLAADMALAADLPVQGIDTVALRAKLEETGIPTKATFRPTVEIEISGPEPVEPGVPVKFAIRPVRLESPLKKFAWCFDGSGEVQSAEESPSHVFAAPGLYQVDLLVEDAVGRSSRLTSKTLRVGDSTEPNFIQSEATPKFVGRWDRTRGPESEYRKKVAFIDRNEGKGKKSATFTAKAPRDGKYLIALAYSSSTNRASNVPVTVRYGDKVLPLMVNQKKRKPALFAFQPLTEVELKSGQEVQVEISNKGTDGFVVADQFRLIWKGGL